MLSRRQAFAIIDPCTESPPVVPQPTDLFRARDMYSETEEMVALILAVTGPDAADFAGR